MRTPHHPVGRAAPPPRAAAGIFLVVLAVVAVACGTDGPAGEPAGDAAATGPPDFATHRQAMDEYIACARDEGIAVEGPWRVPDGALFYLAASGPMGGAVDEQLNACYTADIQAIDREFQLSLPPGVDPEALPAGIQAEIRADAPLDCLGLAPDEHITELARMWEHDQTTYVECLQDA